MAICNKSVETLRALELTKDQFTSIIETDCKDQDRGPILGYTFSEKDKELCESFKKVYQLGFNQLRIFVDDLIKGNPEIDEQAALYYIRLLAYRYSILDALVILQKLLLYCCQLPAHKSL